MSCTAPINITTTTTANSIAGTFNCVYDVNMLSNAAVSLSKDLSHLFVKCTSNTNTKISFYNAGFYIPYEIRIYKPSLHTYNGVPADAELLIVHSSISSNSNGGSDGLIVSVPISMGGNENSGLNAIIKSANTLSAGTIAMNSSVPIASEIDVNEFIPPTQFYVYNGSLPYDSCGGNYYYAVFTQPISISIQINNLIPSGIKTAPPPALLQKSKTGPRNGMGSTANDDHVLVEFVNDSCESDQTNTAFNQSKAQNGNESESSINVINVLWGILIMFFLWVIYWGISCAFFWSKNREGNGDLTSIVTNAVANVVPQANTKSNPN